MLISLIELRKEDDIVYALSGRPAFHIREQMGSSWFSVFPWGWSQEDLMTIKAIYMFKGGIPIATMQEPLPMCSKAFSLLWRAANPSSSRQFGLPHLLCQDFSQMVPGTSRQSHLKVKSSHF